jgi:hypothetical protein
VRAWRFFSVRGRGGGDEQTARRFAGPEDGSGVAQSSDRARLRESMRIGRTEGEPVRWCVVLFEGSNTFGRRTSGVTGALPLAAWRPILELGHAGLKKTRTHK